MLPLGVPASVNTDVPKFENMDPYQSNTDGLLNLLSDYGTTSTSTDLLNLLAGWPGPTNNIVQAGGGMVQNPNYNPSTQPQTQVQTGGGTPPLPPPVDVGGGTQQQPPAAVGTQAPGTQGGQGQGGQGQGGQSQGGQGQGGQGQGGQGSNSLAINPLQIVGILAVVVAIYFVTKKR